MFFSCCFLVQKQTAKSTKQNLNSKALLSAVYSWSTNPNALPARPRCVWGPRGRRVPPAPGVWWAVQAEGGMGVPPPPCCLVSHGACRRSTAAATRRSDPRTLCWPTHLPHQPAIRKTKCYICDAQHSSVSVDWEMFQENHFFLTQ